MRSEWVSDTIIGYDTFRVEGSEYGLGCNYSNYIRTLGKTAE